MKLEKHLFKHIMNVNNIKKLNYNWNNKINKTLNLIY